MADLISRQAAIDALVKAIREDPYYDSNEAINGLGVCDVRVILNDLPSARPEKRTEERMETHACDLIDREAAVDAIYHHFPSVSRTRARTMLHEVPSVQPELPKQFMSDDCISRSELYKKICEAEKLAQERVLDTRSDSPFPSKLNPAYIRYSAQLDERTQFKHMIADARSIQPEIVRCKDCAKREHCRTSTVWAVAPNDDWYCADAERRADNANANA